MIELTTLTAQTVPVGGVVTFDRVLLHSGCGECYNSVIPSSVKLRAQGVYDVEFSANVTNETAGVPVQLSIAVGGSPLPQTARNVQPAAVGDLWVLPLGTFVRNCCCDLDRITIVNTGANPIVINPGASLRISRKS